MFQKEARLTAFIPPTPCTQDMREEVEKVAKKEGVSIAQIMRASVSLFLSSYVENIDNSGRNNQHIEDEPA